MLFRSLNYFRKHSTNTTSKQWKEGYYYTEGSTICKSIISELKLSDQEVRIGLSKFVNLLMREKHLFARDKFFDLLKSIREVNPVIVEQIVSVISRQERKENVKSFFKNLMPF